MVIQKQIDAKKSYAENKILQEKKNDLDKKAKQKTF